VLAGKGCRKVTTIRTYAGVVKLMVRANGRRSYEATQDGSVQLRAELRFASKNDFHLPREDHPVVKSTVCFIDAGAARAAVR
jgi:hypothetical protein